MIKQAIGQIIQGVDLDRKEMTACMTEIMTGQATPAQIGSFITALRLKGETVEEITGAAIVMREKASKINPCKADEIIVDTCGTGGDGKNTFNISTVAAFVVSGAGLKVAKHGNRAVSSKCGSADLLKALGVNMEITPEEVEECIKTIGIGFLFAPVFHKAMKHAIGPRREIGIRTIFNVLGPLTNPCNANCQVLGVYSEKLTEVIAYVLKNLGTKACFVVHGLEGLDEISIAGKTKISELKNGNVKTYTVEPEDFGIKNAKLSDITGGSIEENVKLALDVLKGGETPRQNIVFMNSSAALVAGGMAKNFKEGVEIAKESLRSGKAMEKLEKLKEFTNK